MSDANLDRRRAEVAREQAESAQRALGQYFVAAEAQRVNTSELEALEAELGTVRAQLAAAEAARDKYRAIAEPPPEKFFTKGHYTADVDLTALQVIAELGVAATAVSPLFKIFGDFFGVTIPSREREVQLSGAGAEGKRQYAKRKLLLIPGKTHMKELPAIGGVLHKIQVGEWLLEDDEASYCYVADGANPHHTTIHFNGWAGDDGRFATLERGIHYRFESAYVESHIALPEVEAALTAPTRDLGPLRPAIWDYVATTHELVVPLYELDEAESFGPETTGEAHRAFAVDRLAAGAAMLRDLWWTAWVTSDDEE